MYILYTSLLPFSICVDIGELLRSELLTAGGVELCGRGALREKDGWKGREYGGRAICAYTVYV